MNSRLARAIATTLLGVTAAPAVLASAPAQTQAPSPAAPAPLPPPTADDPSHQSMRIIADVMINGRGPFHFMLDTGATQAVIADAAVARLGLQPDARRLVRVQGVNSRILAPVVHVDSLTFGGLRFRAIDVPVLTGPLFNGLDGILGVDGLGRTMLSVSLLERRCLVAASPRRADRMANATTVRLLSQELPLFSATVAGVRVQVVIDTGATNTLGNPALLVALQKAGAVHGLIAAPTLLDVTPVSSQGVSAVTPPLQLGRVAVQPPAVTFGDYQVFDRWHLSRRPAMLLGMDALATLATFSIDYSRLQLQLLPRAAPLLSLEYAPPAITTLPKSGG